MSQTTQTLVHALKEWQVAVSALEQGETIVLLRKGGIHETGGKFTIAHDRVWLYPTYEHQQPHLVKAQYTSAIVPVASGEHPETVRIGAWAMITDRVAIRSEDQVRALWPFHIWNEAFVAERLKWKPQQPLDLLLLRVYQLNQPQIIPYSTAYGGCKSWIDLTTAIPLDGSTPVLEDSEYRDRCAAIRTAITAPSPLCSQPSDDPATQQDHKI